MQSGAAEEMHDPQRDVPRSLIRAGAIAVVTYVLFLVVILFALPKDQLTGVGSFLNAYQSVASVLPHPIAVGLGWLVALASSGGTWLMGADRTYAIGTLFALVLGFTLSTNTLAYLLIFPAFLLLRYRYPDVPRTYRVPGGMLGAWIVTLLPFAYAAIAAYFILIPTASYVSKSGVSRMTYELTQWVPLILIVGLTIFFYIWGQREKRNRDVVAEQKAEINNETFLPSPELD